MKFTTYFLLIAMSISLLLPTPSVATPTTEQYSQSLSAKKKERKSKLKLFKEKRRAFKNIRIMLRQEEFFADNIEKLLAESDCETLRLKDGQVFKVEIISMDETELIYVPCGKEDAEETTVLLSEVSKITSEDGDLIYKGGGKAGVGESDSKALTYGIISIVCAVLTIIPIVGILAGPLALLFGILALKRIKKHQSDNNNKVLAIIGIILGGLLTLANLILISFFILSGWF